MSLELAFSWINVACLESNKVPGIPNTCHLTRSVSVIFTVNLKIRIITGLKLTWINSASHAVPQIKTVQNVSTEEMDVSLKVDLVE